MKLILGMLLLVQHRIFQKVQQPYPIDHRLVVEHQVRILLYGYQVLGQQSQSLVLRTSLIFRIYPRKMCVLEKAQSLPS